MMKKFFCLMLLGSLITTGVCAADSLPPINPSQLHSHLVPQADAPPSSSHKPVWLIVLHADSASLASCTEQPKHLCLTLKGVNKNIVMFTDHPNRQYKSISTRQFITDWPRSFSSSSPNAAAVHAKLTSIKNSKIQPYVITLSHPQLNGNQLTFRISALNRGFVKGKIYQDINLFIDNMTASFCV